MAENKWIPVNDDLAIIDACFDGVPDEIRRVHAVLWDADSGDIELGYVGYPPLGYSEPIIEFFNMDNVTHVNAIPYLIKPDGENDA